MYGVVLWSDPKERKAVIWCEDHGDLAFYRQPDVLDHVDLDAGDLVQFDLTTERHLRFAHNPRLVSEGVCADLAEALTMPAASPPPVAAPVRPTAEIIPFRSQPAARRFGTASTAVAGG